MMTEQKEYRQCTRCIMDTSTTLIRFDEKGVCNFCHEYDAIAAKTVNLPRDVRYKKFNEIVEKIKEEGKNKKYDCLIGVSGGVDSSYLAYLTKQHKLRPLVVHFDNGWNSEYAIKNIQNIIEKLGYELLTYVIDWDAFKDLQLSYFKASVIDIEVPTDQLIFAALYKVAKENDINYVLSGNNIRTEQIIPSDWIYNRKFDLTNLRNIHKKFGQADIRKFPTLSSNDRIRYQHKDKIEMVYFFNYLDYNQKDVKELLTREFNFVHYPCKHFESVFTRFYQGYILPRKFHVDKRLAHLSTLICSGQITKAEALEEMKHPPYPEKQQLADKEYVCKKWGLTIEEFDRIMKLPPVPHEVYGQDKVSLINKLRKRFNLIYLYKVAYPLGLKKRPE